MKETLFYDYRGQEIQPGDRLKKHYFTGRNVVGTVTKTFYVQTCNGFEHLRDFLCDTSCDRIEIVEDKNK